MNQPAHDHFIGCGGRREPTGLTLIEVTLFLAILTVVVVLTLGIYRSVRDQQLTAQMVYEFQSIRNSVKTLYGGIWYIKPQCYASQHQTTAHYLDRDSLRHHLECLRWISDDNRN